MSKQEEALAALRWAMENEREGYRFFQRLRSEAPIRQAKEHSVAWLEMRRGTLLYCW